MSSLNNSDKFQSLNKSISILEFAIICFILLLMGRLVVLIVAGDYVGVWQLFTPGIAMVSSLLVSRAASRVIINGDITKEYDRKLEIIQTTHHLITISKDLKRKVEHTKKLINDNKEIPAHYFCTLVESMVDRSEALLNQNSYKYLPYECINTINGIIQSMDAIIMYADNVKHLTKSNPTMLIPIDLTSEKFPISISNLETRLQNLLTTLNRLRDSTVIDQKKN